MHVLEDEEQRPLAREAGQQPARRERSVLGVRGAGLEPDGDRELVGEVRRVLRPEPSAKPFSGVAVGELGQQVAKRRVRGGAPVGSAMRDSRVCQAFEALDALDGEACLAQPRRAEDGDEARNAGGDGRFELLGDLAQLSLPSHERCLEVADHRRGSSIDRIDRPTLLPRRCLDRVPDGPPGARRGKNVTGARTFLESGGLVNRSARDKRVAGHDLARREADAACEAR